VQRSISHLKASIEILLEHLPVKGTMGVPIYYIEELLVEGSQGLGKPISWENLVLKLHNGYVRTKLFLPYQDP